MKKGTFTRKKLREIIPGLTRAQENSLIELHLEAMEHRKPGGEEECEEDSSEASDGEWVRVEISLRVRGMEGAACLAALFDLYLTCLGEKSPVFGPFWTVRKRENEHEKPPKALRL